MAPDNGNIYGEVTTLSDVRDINKRIRRGCEERGRVHS